jgi:hypothetical protein
VTPDADTAATASVGWTIAKTLWGFLVTVFTALAAYFIRMVKRHDMELAQYRMTVVTKDDLARMENQHRAAIDELRTQLTSTMNSALDRIERSNENTLKRVEDTQRLILERLLQK